ncbi:MAG: hypothetical protein IJ802_00800 [Kiritimatiellae bacterium]|nr:hypothetical protein [Kiritimatiellia bacterium]
MSKEILVVGVEAGCVRAVRFTAGAKGFAPHEEFCCKDGIPAATADESALAVADDTAKQNEPADGETGVAFLERAFGEVAKKFHAKEIVLALPLSRLLTQSIRVPDEDRDLLEEKAQMQLKAASPFPDEDMLVATETLADTGVSVRAMATALPEASAEEISNALDAAGLKVVRTDATLYGWIETLRERINGGDQAAEAQASSAFKKLLLFGFGGEWDVAIWENGSLSHARGLGAIEGDQLKREVMLTLLAQGAAGFGEVVVFTPDAADDVDLPDIAPVRTEVVEDLFGGVKGVGLRTGIDGACDATPTVWREALAEARFSKKMSVFLAIAGVVWLVIAGAMAGGPFVYDYLTDSVKSLSKAHSKEFTTVRDTKERVALVRRYSNKDTSALEMLRIVCDQMPQGVALSRLQYTKDQKLTLQGDADDAQKVYDFKDRMVAVKYAPAAEQGEKRVKVPMFANVNMKGPTLKRGRQSFTLEASFEAKEDD